MGERAVGAARRRRENTELRRRSGSSTELIGISTGINAVRSAVEKVAPTGSRVLITGPAGAGKEVVARRIHERSRRAAGPFVVLNCATLTPDRLEAELFGTERSEEHTSELQALMRITYAVFCLKKKQIHTKKHT